MRARELVAIWLLVNLVVVGLFDIFAGVKGGYPDTVSGVIRSWGREYPELYIAVGYLLCHLFGR
jgi:hypothetical protein